MKLEAKNFLAFNLKSRFAGRSSNLYRSQFYLFSDRTVENRQYQISSTNFATYRLVLPTIV
jgi:hypothetical protein